MGGLLLFNVGSETDEGVAKQKSLPGLGIEPGTPGPKRGTVSTRLSFYPGHRA